MPDRLNEHESRCATPEVQKALASILVLSKEDIEYIHTLTRPHRIGVWDYDSLVECLKSHFAEAFPGATFRDPQDAIQLLAGTLMECRRQNANSRTTGEAKG